MSVFDNGLIDDLYVRCKWLISIEDYESCVDELVILLKHAQDDEAKADIYLLFARCFNDKDNRHVALACCIAAKKFGAECDEHIYALRKELGCQDAVYDIYLGDFWLTKVFESYGIPFKNDTSKKFDFAESSVLRFYIGAHINSCISDKIA